ncbi:DNA polymerase-3 subunit gamma/tau [Alkalispirochaeta americana]|uniref:DNA polymerase III subunit gamma/tau n=1 Tax=Alkalispirochaeta americana TaxID=159291 RepID=A0A1N6QDI5_9SPIO|nr:DNA polymerase III subunit gamma/tau [Alkalispirochaeta americana]SIQ14612.1 DNA polymerase-3 subunit gamma/tau [Alkalispirochaeta americana]
MSYEVTATRRRPRGFDQLIGQDFVVATLKNSLASGRIAPAYLFAGPRGVGKTSAARILAKALNCPEGPGAEGCDGWEGSEEIARGNSLDVIEIDGASNTSVNDVRQIKDEVLFAPNSSRYKIYIIDEVHMLSNSAFNALLKTIEEPPPYIIFIFATTEIHKVPATIRSRCQQFNFRLIPLEEIRDCLAATARELGVQVEEDALGWIARQATGSLRDAYTLFDQVLAFSGDEVTLDLIHQKLGLLGMERLNALFQTVVNGDGQGALEIVEEALLAGVSVERFILDLADYLRTLLLIKNGIVREGILGISLDRVPQEVRQGLSREQLEQANEIVLQLYRDVRYSVNQRFDLELAVSRISHLRAYTTPQELVDRIEALQHELIHSAAHHLRTDNSKPSDAQVSAETASPPEESSPPPGEDAPKEETTPRAESRQDASGKPEISEETAPEEEIDSLPQDQDQDSRDLPVERQGISEEETEAIIARFRAKRISLAALLMSARSWSRSEGKLVLGFSDNFGAHTLEQDRTEIQEAARAVLGDALLQLVIVVQGMESENETSEPVNQHLDMVRRVFRGELLEEQE